MYLSKNLIQQVGNFFGTKQGPISFISGCTSSRRDSGSTSSFLEAGTCTVALCCWHDARRLMKYSCCTDKSTTWPKVRIPELMFLFIQKREMGEPTHKSEAANQGKLRCTCTTSSRGRGYNQTILLHARHVTKINTLRTVIQVEYIFTNKIKHKPAVNLQMSWRKEYVNLVRSSTQVHN